MNLTGKVALITGASRGIGEGIAKKFAEFGAKIILVSQSGNNEEIVECIRQIGSEVIAFKGDVTNKEEIDNIVSLGVEHFGQIDIVVNNAGVYKSKKFIDTTEEERDYQIDVNIKGVWNVTQAVVPYFIEKKYGKIVMISSVSGYMVADKGQSAYAMSKSAIIGFTKALAVELAEYNITVNAICPGHVLTKMSKGDIDKIAQQIPLGRYGKPEEVGELAAFLASDSSKYITGTQVVFDGGSTLPETII